MLDCEETNPTTETAELRSTCYLSLFWASPHYSTPASLGRWWSCLVGSSWRKPDLPELLWRKAVSLGLQLGKDWVQPPQHRAFECRLQTAVSCCRWEMECTNLQERVLLWLQVTGCHYSWGVSEWSIVLVFYGKSQPWLERSHRASKMAAEKKRDETDWSFVWSTSSLSHSLSLFVTIGKERENTAFLTSLDTLQ